MTECLGKIVFSRHLIRTKLNNVRKIFSILGFVPIDLKNNFNGTIEYSGFSDYFEVLPEGRVVPEYNIIVIVNKYDEIEEIEVERKEIG